MKDCDCADWQKCSPQIDAIMTLAWNHGIQYTGKVFVYCPWCGKRLAETDTEKGKTDETD